MSGRHAAPRPLTPQVRRLGAVVATTSAVAGAGLATLAGSAAAAPAVQTAPAVHTAHASTAKGAPNASSLTTGRLAVAEARKHIGAPYRYGAEGPSAFDCSGLTQYSYGKLGVDLPRSAAQQQDAVRPVAKNQMQPGDLIFQGRNAHHVAMYAGNGKMITAPESGENVKMDDLPSTFTAGRP